MILIEAFPLWNNSLIGALFPRMTDVPWPESQSSQLDFEYFGNRSGEKTVSPIVRRMVGDGEYLQPGDMDKIAGFIADKFRVSWKMLWNSLQMEDAYVPYENYNMNEEFHKTTNDTENSGGQDKTKHGKTTDTDLYHYGFNSTEKQSSGAESMRDGGITAVDHKADSTRNIGEDSTMHRHGNIGVTTNQQMIESEIELRKKNFFDIVYSDVDSVLALKIYDLCKGGK